MQVYVEYVFIDNMLIDLFILSITKKLCKLETNKWIVVLDAFFGTAVSLVSPLVSGMYLIIIKILCAIIMPLILLKKWNTKKYILVLLSFLLSTAIMGGACIMFCSFFGIKYVTNNGAIEIYNFPVGLALLICSLCYFFVKNLIKYFYNIKHLSKYIYDISLVFLDKKVDCKAFLDTGNRLVDSVTASPITLIDFEVLLKLCPNIKLSDILLKKYENLPLKNLHEQEVKSIYKSSKILVFEIDNILVENKIFNNALIGLSLSNFKSNLSTDCILNPLLFD